MEKKSKNYFFTSLLTILLSVGIFLVLKEFLPRKLFDTDTIASDGIVIDSMALSAMSDTDLNLIRDTSKAIYSDSTALHNSVQSDSVDIKQTASAFVIDTADYSLGYGNLEHFFEKLYRLEKTKIGKVRVAYFSDSMTDGDLIVQDIRKEYQKKYGGMGVGFVGITSLSAGSRGSVSHTFSKNWQNQSFLKTQNPRRPFGIDGQVAFVPKGVSSWVKYQAGNNENSRALYHPTIFYGNSRNRDAIINLTINSDSIIKQQLNTANILNTFSLDGSPNSLKIDFSNADSIPFYGVNFDNGWGFYIDNFSIRGNSGLPLSLLNVSLMNAFDKVLKYDLIILHYGANVLNYKVKDYSWYKRNMTNVVNHLNECFPNADILIVSTADKSDKVNGQMQTSVAVAPLIRAQAEYALNTQSAFLNLYALMGGYGSMVEWVNNSLANKDYTHFSIKGAHRIGSLIYDELDNGYKAYKNKKLRNYE